MNPRNEALREPEGEEQARLAREAWERSFEASKDAMGAMLDGALEAEVEFDDEFEGEGQ